MTAARADLEAARQAARHHRDRLMTRAGVVGVGASTRVAGGRRTDEPSVTAFVAVKYPPSLVPADALLPAFLPGPDGRDVRVDVVEVGVLSAPMRYPVHEIVSPATSALRVYRRPAVGGGSAAHWRFPIGTMACAVGGQDGTGTTFALSCAHVFGLLGQACTGDPILAPAPVDGGSGLTTLGWYARSAPLHLDGSRWSRADASVALCPPGACDGDVDGLGQPSRVRSEQDLTVGELVWKVGRTTGLTEGSIVAVGVHARVDYSALGFGSVALLEDVIMTSPMCAYGDSGSLLVDTQRRAVGMLFGGTTRVTLYCSMLAVLTELALTLPLTPADATWAASPGAMS